MNKFADQAKRHFKGCLYLVTLDSIFDSQGTVTTIEIWDNPEDFQQYRNSWEQYTSESDVQEWRDLGVTYEDLERHEIMRVTRLPTP
mmetsp:Transcript_21000/g.32914  ORF Transcript_21000/g.32914 Transcript_21000/m.32914 type:complete len:87 (+) Transcript_21000:177-437(+)